MSEVFYRPGAAELAPGRRLAAMPDGRPAPTGYYPDRSYPDQGQASFSEVYDELYGPARQEKLNGFEDVDQHPYLQVTANWTPEPQSGRLDGRDDPMNDGPAQPTLRLSNLFYQRAIGTSVTNYLDAPGIRYPPNGSQDGASWTYYQDARLALLDYNPPADGNGEMPDTLRAMPPSPPHGWAAQAVNARQLELDKAQVLRGQKGPHQDRLANSTYAGQSYSATTSHVGASGTGGTGSTRSWRSRG